MNPIPDTMTVLRARGPRLAKLLHADGRCDEYDSARTFAMHSVAVHDVDSLAGLLARLLHRPDCCAIRGDPLNPTNTSPQRRLLHVCPKTGDLPTVREQARCWLALDVEGVALPPDVPAADLRRCAGLALPQLPQAFTGARCIVQATAGHGFKPDLRLRMWFWCARPMGGAELKRWLRGAPADPSVFGAVQPIYTAAPVFAPGCSDPLPARMLVLDGAAVVTPPTPATLAPPPQPQRAGSYEPVAPEQAHAYVRAALVRAAIRISTTQHPGRHPAIVGETSRLARFVGPGLLTEGVIANVVRDAARRAGKDDDGEVSAAIVWGLAHPWDAGPLPEAHHGRWRDA